MDKNKVYKFSFCILILSLALLPFSVYDLTGSIIAALSIGISEYSILICFGVIFLWKDLKAKNPFNLLEEEWGYSNPFEENRGKALFNYWVLSILVILILPAYIFYYSFWLVNLHLFILGIQTGMLNYKVAAKNA